MQSSDSGCVLHGADYTFSPAHWQLFLRPIQVGWSLETPCAISSSYPPVWQQIGLPCLVTQTEKQKHDAASLATITLGRKLRLPVVEFLA